MAKKPALGRGLGALLPEMERTTEEEGHFIDAPPARGAPSSFELQRKRVGRVSEIPIDRIDPNPYQPRSDFDSAGLDELAASIRELGIVQPITVRSSGEGRFELISGERRLRAARRAGLSEIPAFVREADTEAMLEMALVENLQRKDLNAIEIAMGYERLIEECALTHEEVARKVGKNRATVTNTLRLLKLPVRVQAAVREGALSQGHARVLAGIEDQELQLRLFDRVVQNDLSVRAIEKLARKWADISRPGPRTEPAPLTTPQADPNLQAITDQLRRTFGTRVTVSNRKDGSGRIELDYFSAEELERLLELLLR